MKIRVIRDTGDCHPTETRSLKVGDVFKATAYGNYWKYESPKGTQYVLGLNVEVLAEPWAFAVGTKVRITKDQANNAKIDGRYVRVGDIVTVTKQWPELERVYYRNQDAEYFLTTDHIEPVSDLTTSLVCNCESLLNGHVFGCDFYKEL